MRVPTPIQVLAAAAAIAAVAGCSNGSAMAPKPTIPQSHQYVVHGQYPVSDDPLALLKINANPGRAVPSFYTCPPTGQLTYISDYINDVVNVYLGTFAGQAPCGDITNASAGLINPQGLFVKSSNHDLYVANSGGNDILVFARGATVPFIAYPEPGELPRDVTVASTGIVIASNSSKTTGGPGSIATWKANTMLVGIFTMPNPSVGGFVTVENGAAVRIFFNFTDNAGIGRVYMGHCPGGLCTAFSPTGPTTATKAPAGLRLRAADTRLVQFDQHVGGSKDWYKVLPGFPTLASCAIGGSDPIGFDMDASETKIFYADAVANVAGEIHFGSCGLIGTVPGIAGGMPVGAAHDPPEPL